MVLQEKLLSLRKNAGFSQEELAEKLNVSRQAVSKWERGEASPDMNNAIAISRIYGISLDEIARCITGEESKGISLRKDDYINIRAYKENISDGEVYPPKKEEFDTLNEKAYVKEENVTNEENKIISTFLNRIFDSDTAYDSKREETAKKLLKFPVWALCILIFFFVGGVFDKWYVSWTVFLLIPVYYMTIKSYRLKNMSYFPFPLIILYFYLFVICTGGYFFGRLASFLTIFCVCLIPLYYTFIKAYRKKKCKYFCFPVLCVIVYFFFALGTNHYTEFLWIFAFIPFYYVYSSKIDKILFKVKK